MINSDNLINTMRYLDTKANTILTESGDEWMVDQFHLVEPFSYDHFFDKLLKELLGRSATIYDLLKQKKDEGKPTNVVDFMGAGVISLNADIEAVVDIMTVFRLKGDKSRFITEMNKYRDRGMFTKGVPNPVPSLYLSQDNFDGEHPKIKFVEGNVFDSNFPTKFKEVLDERYPNGCDLMIIRPFGAEPFADNGQLTDQHKEGNLTIFALYLIG